MNKKASKLSFAFVCVIFGFLISYQVKALYIKNTKIDINKQSAEILLENEQLEKQKEELRKKIDELEGKISQYEQAAAGRDEKSKVLLEELDKMRALNGFTNVKGTGIILNITPKSNIFGSTYEGQPITDLDLLTIVNEFFSAGAEAVSINEIRITSKSGIRTARNSISISQDKISYNEPVEIKAIGNTGLLEAALKFPGNIPGGLYNFCNIEWKVVDELEIIKSNEVVQFEYAFPIEK
jgi:uncharacterized protein YlxW (UPF0749 family)